MLRLVNYSRREPTWVGAPDVSELVVAVVPRAMRQIRAVARSQVSGLSVPSFRSLVYLERHPGAGLTALAEHLGVTLPGASGMVGRLVAAGLVDRAVDPNERRRITIVLTDAGRARVAASAAAVKAWWHDRLSDLSESQLAALRDGLAVLDSVLADVVIDAPSEVA
jgi:DNA-binding MarR family transcriptional regulator